MYTVYQQNIDWDKIDKKGRTNLERALKGIAPLGDDGKSINLHHSKQDARGSLFELSKKLSIINTIELMLCIPIK